MAGTVSVAYSIVDRTSPAAVFPPIKRAVIDWVSSAGGGADGAVVLEGEILKVVTNPGATAPTDNYDVTLVDEDGFDALEGYGANRDTATTEAVYPLKKEEVTLAGTLTDRGVVAQRVVVSGAYTFTVANAGDTKAGRCTIYFR